MRSGRPTSQRHDVQVNTNCVLLHDYWIVVKDDKGAKLPNGNVCMGGSELCGPVTLAPGQSGSQSGFINLWSKIDKPGTCEATASIDTHMRAGPAESNTVTFTLVATSDASRDARFSEAVRSLEAADTREEKRRAVSVLGYTLDRRAIPVLVKATRTSKQGSTWVLDVLRAFFDRDEVCAALVNELRDFGPTEDLAQLVFFLKADPKQTVPLLTGWLKNGGTSQRAASLQALGRTPAEFLDEAAEPLVVQALDDANTDVRRHAVDAAAAGYPNTMPKVSAIALHDPDAEVRGWASIALGAYKD